MTKETDDVQDVKIKELKDTSYENKTRIKWLEDHWSVFNGEMGIVQTDIKWIKKFMWWIVGTMVGGFGGIFGILIDILYRLK